MSKVRQESHRLYTPHTTRIWLVWFFLEATPLYPSFKFKLGSCKYKQLKQNVTYHCQQVYLRQCMKIVSENTDTHTHIYIYIYIYIYILYIDIHGPAYLCRKTNKTLCRNKASGHTWALWKLLPSDFGAYSSLSLLLPWLWRLRREGLG